VFEQAEMGGAQAAGVMRKGMIQILTLYSGCNSVREHIFDVTVRPYLESNFFFPDT